MRAAGSTAVSGGPTLRLVTTSSWGESVSVKQGAGYSSCRAGQLPGSSTPCEPGAVVTGPGASALTRQASAELTIDQEGNVVDGSLSPARDRLPTHSYSCLQILACPPDSCLSYGCPGYKYSDVGLAPCGVDTTAPVGTAYR